MQTLLSQPNTDGDTGFLSDQLGIDTRMPNDAPWSMLNQWQGPGLPLGVGNEGLISINPEQHPHLLIAGTSGSGKTYYGLRPLITAALASGWQVIILDRSGVDFRPFRTQPNARIILLHDPATASDYLFDLYLEIQSRFEVLREAGVGTWGRLSGSQPRILIAIDEFANLADSLPNSQRNELWRAARMIAAEGRKAGVHLLLALQDPTHKSLDLRIRRNCTPVSFRVKDEAASRVVLGARGAETLQERQFLTVVDNLVSGVAFAPSDGEIVSFLQARVLQ